MGKTAEEHLDKLAQVFDRKAREPSLQVDDWVFFNPAAHAGKEYKFSRPFNGPYQILKLYKNGADIRLVDKLKAMSVRVALNRL